MGVLRLKQAELEVIDTKTQKVLTKANVHHEHSEFHRLNFSIQDGGRGIVGVVDTQQLEWTKIAQYMEGYEEPLVHIVNTTKGQQVYLLISWAQVVNKGGTINEINK